MSALGGFIKKAQDALSNLRGGSNFFEGKNGDVVYSKNNVCVHEVVKSGDEAAGKDDSIVHSPGYLTVHCQSDEDSGVTLILQWLPNTTLHKNPASIRSVSPRGQSDRSELTNLNRHKKNGERREKESEEKTKEEVTAKSGDIEISLPDIDTPNDDPPQRPKTIRAIPAKPANGEVSALFVPSINVIPNTPVGLHSDDEDDVVVRVEKVEMGSTSSLSTSGADDSDREENEESSCDDSEDHDEYQSIVLDRYRRECSSLLSSTPEKYASDAGMVLNESSQGVVGSVMAMARGRSAPATSGSLFSVNLGKMRSMRVFFSDPENTCGQIVLASMDSRYKILHFHHGGLDKLSQLFEQWSAIKARSVNGSPSPQPDRHLIIWQPSVSKGELDPEDGLYDAVSHALWKAYKNRDGAVDDSLTLRKAIFFASIDSSLRREIWPFLLRVYPWESTVEEREAKKNDLFLEYQTVKRRRIKKSNTTMKAEWGDIENAITKDVVRTDKRNPFYEGEDNQNVNTMKNILLNYAAAHPRINYIQGMSDLVAPLLSIIRDECETYWCFCGLMQTTLFASPSSIHENLMEINLEYLRELLKLLVPDFFTHLISLKGDAPQLIFVHRWILLCFKREFPEHDALHIWEACWSRYRTSHFHLFICVAIISVYGKDIITQKLPHDEMLLYFASLANHMDAKIVLKKARGLLYSVCRMERLPCSLAGLVDSDASEQWDSHRETVQYECTQLHGDEMCPFDSKN
ncbi:tbc-16 [Pristionchus pacificus]|uniref:Tbc-16 n=1 Tax=Pristionchus pacificus TaxID=54126 RepID=A0A454XZ16_PRIPA|nr:tbc-16 [Pristionchus pacificus]|eukprot:PDM63346.1 tbc-16 [Pristionchus pacificus]